VFSFKVTGLVFKFIDIYIGELGFREVRLSINFTWILFKQ